jgi:uncharacterized membrane protein
VSSYFILKGIHITSAAVLFGTGLGIAFLSAIRVSEKVVRAAHQVLDAISG